MRDVDAMGVIEDLRIAPETAIVARSRLTQLTPRESEVLALVAHGMSNGDIARQLFLSEATVKTHVGRILMKMDLRDRAQAVAMAYQTGFVRVGEPPHGVPGRALVSRTWRRVGLSGWSTW